MSTRHAGVDPDIAALIRATLAAQNKEVEGHAESLGRESTQGGLA